MANNKKLVLIGIVITVLLILTLILLIHKNSNPTGNVIVSNYSLNNASEDHRLKTRETNLDCNVTYTGNQSFHMVLVTGEIVDSKVENTTEGIYATMSDSKNGQETITKFLNGNCISKVLFENISV